MSDKRGIERKIKNGLIFEIQHITTIRKAIKMTHTVALYWSYGDDDDDHKIYIMIDIDVQFSSSGRG